MVESAASSASTAETISIPSLTTPVDLFDELLAEEEAPRQSGEIERYLNEVAPSSLHLPRSLPLSLSPSPSPFSFSFFLVLFLFLTICYHL